MSMMDRMDMLSRGVDVDGETPDTSGVNRLVP